MRDEALDQLRGIAVIWIHYIDCFFLLWNGIKGFDFFGGFVFDNFPVYAMPPILFAFCTGVSLTYWKEKHDFTYLITRCGLLLLSGFLLSYYVDGRFDHWGLFEMIALCNFILFFANSAIISIAGISIILIINHIIPPFYSFNFPTVPYFFEYKPIPFIVSQALVSGLFPLIPFLSWAFWGVVVGRYKKNLIKISLVPLLLGLILRIIQPFVYSQLGNIYSASTILISMGFCSVLLFILEKIHIPQLTVFGRWAWRLTFWRFIFFYLPFVWAGLFRSFDNLEAVLLSIILSIAQILLFIVPKSIKKYSTTLCERIEVFQD